MQNEEGTSRSLTAYYNRISEISFLEKGEEKKLCEQIKKGGRAAEKARARLLEANLKLVIKIAHKYKNYGMDLEDLVNEGNIGLMKASEKFDPKRNCKFASYASFWIKQKIYKALSLKSRLIKLPAHAVDKHLKILKFISEFSNENHRLPDKDEISNYLHLSKSFVANLLESGVTNIISMHEEKLNESCEDVTPEHFIKDDNAPDPRFEAEKNENLNNLKKFLSKLNERERFIVLKRFGVNSNREETLDEVGKKCGLSRERVRQVQDETLAKLGDMFRKEYET